MTTGERWVDAITADIRDTAVSAVSLARNGSVSLANRLTAVRNWYKFVHLRAADRSASVLPTPLRSAEMAFVMVSAVAMTFLFVDPVFLAHLRANGPTANGFFEVVTWFGQSAWILYLSGAAIVAYALLRTEAMAKRQRVSAHRVFLVFYFLFTTVAFSGLLVNLFKMLIGRARPPFTTEGHVWISQPFGDNYDFASFPSGHATTAGALTVAMCLLFPKLRTFFVVIGAWIAVSRPALGVHFPSDVLAGFLFGGTFSWIYARMFARKRLLFAFERNGSLRVRGRPVDDFRSVAGHTKTEIGTHAERIRKQAQSLDGPRP